MILFIHLQVKPITQIQFKSEWVENVKKEFPDAIIFEADNHSEPYTIQQGIDFLQQASKIVLLIECSPNEKLGVISSLVEKVLRSKNHAPLIFLNGENKMFEKMAKISKSEVFAFKELATAISRIGEHLKG